MPLPHSMPDTLCTYYALRSRLVFQPKSEIFHSSWLRIDDSVNRQDLSVGSLQSIEVGDVIPKFGFCADVILCEHFQTIDFGLWIDFGRFRPSDHNVISKCRHNVCFDCNDTMAASEKM